MSMGIGRVSSIFGVTILRIKLRRSFLVYLPSVAKVE